MEDTVRTFAKNHGYDSVRQSIKWSGYNVYEPFCYGESDFLGYSIYILACDGNVRLTTRQEAHVLNGLIRHC